MTIRGTKVPWLRDPGASQPEEDDPRSPNQYWDDKADDYAVDAMLERADREEYMPEEERHPAELRAEEIEAALLDLLGCFYEYRNFVMLRISSGGEMALPNSIADAVRTAYAALGETLPCSPFRPKPAPMRR